MTMSEDATAAAAAPASNGKDEKNNGKGAKKRDETPIEELYDLSKPIPKVRTVGDWNWTVLRRNVPAFYGGIGIQREMEASETGSL